MSSQTRLLERPDGTRLAWDERGTGPSVVLVHGIGYTRHKWQAQVEALASAGYRVLRFDLRGFGESEAPERPFELDDFIGDLVAFADDRALDRFHLVGHSLGGMLAQRYVVEHPARVTSLALASTTSHNGRRATAFARLMVTFGEHGFDAVMHDAALRAEAEAILKEAFSEGVDLRMLKRGMEERNMARANAWRACIGFSTKDELSRIRCPVLVTHGTADALIPFRAGQLVHEAIEGSEWIAEEGAGHSLPKQRAESFNRALIEFLRRAEE